MPTNQTSIAPCLRLALAHWWTTTDWKHLQIACMVPRRLSLSSNRNRTVWSEYLTSFFVCVCDELASIRTHIRLVYNVLWSIFPLYILWLSTYTKDTSFKKNDLTLPQEDKSCHRVTTSFRQRIRNVHTRQLSTWAVVRVKANIQSNVSNVLRIFIKCSSVLSSKQSLYVNTKMFKPLACSRKKIISSSSVASLSCKCQVTS